jgi:hypothetical protein
MLPTRVALLPVPTLSAPLSAPLLVLALLLGGCGNGAGAQRTATLEEGRAKLADDPSGALFLAKDAFAREREAGGAPHPELFLLAASACLRLERRNEAYDYASHGLAAEDLDDDLRADLLWARGAALMGRYRELGDEADWRAANTELEKATQAGSHRLDAAFLLVGLQDLGAHENTERQLRFARLVIELDSGEGRDGSKAALVRALLEQKGLTP